MLRAAMWKTTEASADELADEGACRVTEPSTNSTPVGRISSRPVNRSSSTVTRAPASHQAADERATDETGAARDQDASAAERAFDLARSSLDPEAQEERRPEQAPPVAQAAHLRVALVRVVADRARVPRTTR